MIDKDEYPAASELENRCVSIVASLWNAPNAENAIGTSTSGSSEACMLGGLAALRRWKMRRQAKGLPTDKPNIVTGAVQVCWHKFANFWEVELREIPMRPGKGGTMANGEEVLKYVDENTILVVCTLGLTFTLEYEPVGDIAASLDKYAQATGINVDMHVDGASGGFLAPFIQPDLVWDFRIPRVASISSSGHKHGLAALGVGWLVFREKSLLPESLISHVNYLGGDMAVFALNFSKPAGPVLSQYYNFIRLGRQGYRKIHGACQSVGIFLAEQIGNMDKQGNQAKDASEQIFDMMYDGKSGIPGCCWSLKAKVDWSLFDLADRLRSRGWLVPAYTLPTNLQDLPVQRILVRHGFSRELADALLRDISGMIAQLDKHHGSLTEAEAGGFKHT
jgi:glutamate decarboxylase